MPSYVHHSSQLAFESEKLNSVNDFKKLQGSSKLKHLSNCLIVNNSPSSYEISFSRRNTLFDILIKRTKNTRNFT